MEMLAILRGGGSRSTRDAISSLPESPIEMRKKHRSMMKKQKSKIINKTETPKEQVDFERKDIYKLPSATKKLMKTTSSTSCLVEVAIDSRPSIPSLPNPEGIELLVLAGYLSPLNRPRPGKIAPVTLLKRLENLETSVLCIQCDQRKIIAGCSDRLIRVYDIRSGRLVSILNGHKGSVQCLQFDDHKLVSGSWDTTCIVWDIVNFSILLVLTGHTDCVISLEFCNDILVTGSYDKTIMIWDTITWTCLRSIQHAHSRPITCLSFDGITIISGSEDKTVKLWDVTSAKCLSVLEHSSRITSLRFSKLLLVTACGDGSINLWNLINKRLQIKWEQKYTIAMSCIVDIFIDKGKVYTAASDGVLYEWDIAMGVCARTLAGHSNSLTALWVGDSKIVTTSYDQTICVWYTNKNYIETNAEEDNQTEEFYRRIPVRVLLTDNN
jgi:WD40 repeat protein